MPVLHKFQNYSFNERFKTDNSILNIVPYYPEVIFIGTFNHGWSWNQSDFFYGRGMYMWPILANLFLFNCNQLISPRNINNDIPSLNQILEICEKGKIVFADIVKGIKNSISTIEQPESKSIIVNNQFKWSSYKDKPLDFMGSNGWMDDNVNSIIQYINDTKSIKHIYFTFKSGDWLVEKMNEIRNRIRKDVSVCSIFTPTGNGFGSSMTTPFHERAWSLTHCWLWNNISNQHPINKRDYGNLDHNWLVSKNVTVTNF